MRYNGIVDSAFVRVYVVAAGVAILVWSVAVAKNKALGLGIALYGGLLGLTTVVGVLAGFLSPESHAFALVLVGQALWFLIAGIALWREPRGIAAKTA
jgi:tryptophan-rich sensory protein